MGKSLPSPNRIQDLTRIITSDRIHQHPRPTQLKPASNRIRVPPLSSAKGAAVVGGEESSEQQRRRANKLKSKNNNMEEESSNSKANNCSSSSLSTMTTTEQQRRVPLADVVADCVKRWFQDTLKEAKAGDTNMQVLVGQMYYSGYGVSRDAHKGRAWISRASKSRSSAWKVCDKRPGYNASDSDSDDDVEDTK